MKSEKSAQTFFPIKMESHVLSLLVVHDVDAVVLSAFNVHSASATIYLPFFPLSLLKTSFSSINAFLFNTHKPNQIRALFIAFHTSLSAG